MENRQASLFEKGGVVLFDGVPIKTGDYVKIDGVAWKVLGSGRSMGKTQALFLWVRNERFGTSIFSPSLEGSSPHCSQRPLDNESAPLPLTPNFHDVASLAKAKLSPERWARFKKEILQKSPFVTAA